MHVPYQFNYTQFISGIIVHIPYNYNYTWLNVTHFPVVTSPMQLKLFSDSFNNVYYIGSKILGRAIQFYGILLDYFDKPADATEFYLKCIECKDILLINTQLVIDNMSPLTVNLVCDAVKSSTNVSVRLSSNIEYYFHQIEVTLVIMNHTSGS